MHSGSELALLTLQISSVSNTTLVIDVSLARTGESKVILTRTEI